MLFWDFPVDQRIKRDGENRPAAMNHSFRRRGGARCIVQHNQIPFASGSNPVETWVTFLCWLLSWKRERERESEGFEE
ncbi:hypothetical protein V6N12_075780 [Hibiscus sabdariffa]|uniref:Uncharacterized protein n=1 Tax=Hibiscus sabdariffa TaxID=183260 RepID=A0ABR2C8L7_9ROSI